MTLKKGQIIFIPAYWWYSIWFQENTSLVCFKYKTYMNNIAISNHLLVNMLQNQNVKREIAKKKNIEQEVTEDSNSNSDDKISA